MKRRNSTMVAVLMGVGLLLAPSFAPRAWGEGVMTVSVTVCQPYIIGRGAQGALIRWFGADGLPVNYTGDVTVTITHDPKGCDEFTRDDPYWNPEPGAVQTQTNTYFRGARVSNGTASPPYGPSITIHVRDATETYATLGIASFGQVTLTVAVGGASASVSFNDIWVRGRATTYPDTADGRPAGPYIVAIPYASWDQDLLAQHKTLIAYNTVTPNVKVVADISFPGPMVPAWPHYSPGDQKWNHYWGSAGWPPLAVSLSGKIRAMGDGHGVNWGDYTFQNQIIDFDTSTKDGGGKSAADWLGIAGVGEGTVDWRF